MSISSRVWLLVAKQLTYKQVGTGHRPTKTAFSIKEPLLYVATSIDKSNLGSSQCWSYYMVCGQDIFAFVPPIYICNKNSQSLRK